MSEPEIKFVVDEYGRILYRVTNEGVLLSKDEKEFIASHILHLQAENAKLRELVSNCHGWLAVNCEKGYVIPRNGLDAIEQSMHELGIEVTE